MTQVPAIDPNESGSLQELLERARQAAPLDRISSRDMLAAHGDRAITALTPWLDDPKLRGFAIRTIARTGALSCRERAIEVLRSVTPRAPEHVRADIAEALAALGARVTSTRSRGMIRSSATRDGTLADASLSSGPLVIRTGRARRWDDGSTWTTQRSVTRDDETSGWALERAVRLYPDGRAADIVRLSQWDRVPGGWRFRRAPTIIARATMLELTDEGLAAGILEHGHDGDQDLEVSATDLLRSWPVGMDDAYRVTRLDGDLVRLRWEIRSHGGWRSTNATPTINPAAMLRVADWLR